MIVEFPAELETVKDFLEEGLRGALKDLSYSLDEEVVTETISSLEKIWNLAASNTGDFGKMSMDEKLDFVSIFDSYLIDSEIRREFNLPEKFGKLNCIEGAIITRLKEIIRDGRF
jgi:hypothetical protein